MHFLGHNFLHTPKCSLGTLDVLESIFGDCIYVLEVIWEHDYIFGGGLKVLGCTQISLKQQ